jgi:hypothetical protein
MPILGQLWTGPAEPPPTRGFPTAAPFEDHTLANHDDFSFPVVCDVYIDDQPDRHSVGLLSVLVEVFAES